MYFACKCCSEFLIVAICLFNQPSPQVMMIIKANLTFKVFTELCKSTHLALIICALCLCSLKAYSARLIDCKTGDTCIIKDKNTEEFQVKIIGSN